MNKSDIWRRIKGNEDRLAIHKVVFERENGLIGQRAREIREEMALSVRSVAKEMGISAMMLSDLERGNRKWSLGMADKWQSALKALTS